VLKGPGPSLLSSPLPKRPLLAALRSPGANSYFPSGGRLPRALKLVSEWRGGEIQAGCRGRGYTQQRGWASRVSGRCGLYCCWEQCI
jgi:hypothetical protein